MLFFFRLSDLVGVFLQHSYKRGPLALGPCWACGSEAQLQGSARGGGKEDVCLSPPTSFGGPENFNQKENKSKAIEKAKRTKVRKSKTTQKAKHQRKHIASKLTFKLETQNLSKIPIEELAAFWSNLDELVGFMFECKNPGVRVCESLLLLLSPPCGNHCYEITPQKLLIFECMVS